MVKSNDKHAFDEATFSQDEASLSPSEAGPEPEASSSLGEANSGPDDVTSDLDMRIDLAPEWAEFEEGAGSDHDEIPEGIDYTKGC